MNFFRAFRSNKNGIKERPWQEQMAMARVVKIEPDWNGTVDSVALWTVHSLNNQKLLHRPINKIMFLVENGMVQFPTAKTNKGQDDTITRGEPYVEAQRKQLSVKIKL